MLKIKKTRRSALSESAKEHLKKKITDKKINESLNEADDISHWSGKSWNNGEYVIDKNALVKVLKDDAKHFIEDQGGGCFTHPIDDNLAVCVGWSEGYDDDPNFINDNGYRVVAGIKAYRSDDMRTDYDWINYPYLAGGDVIEYSDELPSDTESAYYGDIADWLIEGYNYLRNYDVAKDGELKEIEEEGDDLYDFDDELEVIEDD